MKKILLGLVFLFSFQSYCEAQSFTNIVGDTATKASQGKGDGVAIPNYIKNISANPIRIKWRIVNYNFPTGWQFDGLCDDVQCYTAAGGILNGIYKRTGVIAAGATIADFHAIITDTAATVGSSAFVRAELTDTATNYTRTVTFIATRNTLGVSTVVSYDDEVELYPNPAHNAVNITFSAAARVKNIAIYNLIGKVVSVYRVTGNSAKLEIDDLPAGIYFARLTDVEGKLVATRKFTHQ